MREKFPVASLAMAGLIFVLAVAALLTTKALAGWRFFAAGDPAFSVQDRELAVGTGAGSIPLRRGIYYVVELDGEASGPFTVSFLYQDGTTSRAFVFTPLIDGTLRRYRAVIQAKHDDPAATVMLGRAPESAADVPPASVRPSRFSVTALNPWYSRCRVAVRIVALLAFAGTSLYLLWRWFRRKPTYDPSATVLPSRFWNVRALACWAVFALVAGGMADAFFVYHHHSRLLVSPYRNEAFRPSIEGWDGAFYYFWLRSVAVDGDIDFTNDLLYCDSLPVRARLDALHDLPKTPTGLLPDKYPIGWALLEAPWYAAGDLAVQAINATGGHVAYDGWQPVYQIFLVFGQIFYSTASLYFGYRILTEYLSPAAAVCGLVFGWLGSPQIYYQTLDVAMSHNVMLFSVTAAYYFTLRLRANPDRWGNWFLVGLLSAFVILARYQGVVMLMFPGVVCVRAVFGDFRRARGLLLGIVAGALPLGLQAVAWKLLYGSFVLYTYQGETFNWTHPHLVEVLFSPFHGLFNWHPLMLVAFAGFFAWAVRSRRGLDAACFAVSLLATVYINAAWSCWWFGSAFGARAFDGCTLFAMLGLGFVFQIVSTRAVALHLTALACLLAGAWNLHLMYMVENDRVRFGEPLPWRQRVDLCWNYWHDLP